jgi:hypothetical protein
MYLIWVSSATADRSISAPSITRSRPMEELTEQDPIRLEQIG